jgi:hypothetical protein
MEEKLPYWMQTLTEDERKDLGEIVHRAIYGDVDETTLEGRAMLLVNRLNNILHEIEETPVAEALEGSAEDFEEDEG